MWERGGTMGNNVTSAPTRERSVAIMVTRNHSDMVYDDKYHYYIIYRVDYLSGSYPRRRPRGNDRIEGRCLDHRRLSRRQRSSRVS